MSDENDDALGLKLLAELDKADIDNTYEWAQKNKVDHDQLSSFIKSYWGRKIIEPKSLSLEFNLATDEGKQVAELGSAEFRVYNTIAESDGGISKADLMSKLEKSVAGNGIGAAMKNKWIRIDAGKYVADASKADEVRADAVAQLLRGDLDALDKPQQTLLKKRKLLKLTKITAFQVTKGEKFTTTPPKLAFDLTLDMINTGSWQTVEWKKHNFGGLGVRPAGGSLHPLLKARAEYRQIFLEMGFEEMRTNRWVESSFWNFDALFQPQQHPARDAHDTFFVGEPANGPEQHAPPTEYVEKVKRMHEQGGQGSIGYRYQWSLEEAKKNILRTHTTAVSTRTLYELAKDFEPKKFFSIDRVFRNEKMDATHLAEFHQIEGIIIGPDLTLGDLIGTIKQFFARVGVHRIKFKPAYNPYTEPSMEIFAHHPLLNKWVEIGNSGMFRPEMLLPMGFPPNIRAIAWGFGLERPVMIKYGISNIRDLVGHKLDLNFVKTNPLCRLDKD